MKLRWFKNSSKRWQTSYEGYSIIQGILANGDIVYRVAFDDVIYLDLMAAIEAINMEIL